MKPSIMDKIRILRSNRRKTTYTNRKIIKGTPEAGSVVTQVIHTPGPHSVITEATQQWVPVLVLDIPQGKGGAPIATSVPVTRAIPVSIGSPGGVKNIAIKKSILVKNTVPVRNTGLVAQSIPVTTAEDVTLINSQPENNRVMIADEPLDDPLASTAHMIPSLEPTETQEKEDNESLDKPVNCVLCDKNFPSLKDMQAHYLSKHKARRGRDSRKRKTNGDGAGIQTASSPESELVIAEQERDEAELSVSNSEKVDPKCPVCYIQFKTSEEVKSHVKEVHAYVCSECNGTFYNLIQFTSHKCNKVTKKAKRVRKKSSAKSKVNNSNNNSNNNNNNNKAKPKPKPKPTSKPGNLKPEVVKIMNRFVQIQPKSKRKGKDTQGETESSSPPPPLQRISGASPQVSILSDSTLTQGQSPEAVSGGEAMNFAGATAGDSHMPVTVDAPCLGNQVEESIGKKMEEDNSFFPSIKTSYTLKSPSDLATNTPTNESEDMRECRSIKVIETNNIDQAKKLVQRTDGDRANNPNKEQIREKIAQLKRNPSVSLSWQPTLKVRNFLQDDGDYVCGRCNVLCDDMEDYMDHLQDCLTMSSVSLEPVPPPPRRLLRLSHEVASFGSRGEAGRHNNRYGLNRNLMNKLQAFLPSTTHPAGSSMQQGIPATDQPFMASHSTSSHTFRDLIVDSFGYGSQELEAQIDRTPSPLNPVAQLADLQAAVPSANHHRTNDSVTSLVAAQRISTSNSKGSKPMVMIPVNPSANLNISVIPEQLLRIPKDSDSPENSQDATGDFSQCRETPALSPSPVASPLDMLLDQEEIKMEVEEEVVEDHYEIKEERELEEDLEEGRLQSTCGRVNIGVEENDSVSFMEEEDERDGEERLPEEEEKGKMKRLVCGLCGRGYSCLAALRGHLSRQHRVGSGYTCELCGAVGGTRAAFKRHLLRTHGPDTLALHHFLIKCRHCGEGVATLPLLYQHIILHHQEVLPQYHRCLHCPFLFTTRQGLTRHYKRRHKGELPPPAEPIPCPDCDLGLPSLTALKEHRRTCSRNAPPRHPTDTASSSSTDFKCDLCSAAFAFKSYLLRHIKKVHQSKPRPQSYRCAECGREYRHKGRLERHISALHSTPDLHPLYPCPTCTKTFTSYEKRKSHQRRTHRDRTMWQCGECHRSFLTADDLDLHRHTRHKGSCPVCGKVFLRRDSLREHLLIHNGPRLPCPHCSKTFTQGSNLKRHIRIHTGEKPYKCTYCHKPFGDRSACKSHMLVHTGEGRCSCPTCGATFSKRQKLTYHMRLHTGEGLLHCPLCSRPATNTYDLKKHLETHQVALLTALRGSLIYSELQDLPELALKALHNLVWVAVQNSERDKQREEGDVESNDAGERKVASVEELRGRSGSDGLERTAWTCVGVTIKAEETETGYDEPEKSVELLNGRKKGKNGKLRQFRKASSDNGTTASDPLIAKRLIDLSLEQQKLGLKAEVNGSGSERNRQCCDSNDKFGSDSEEEEQDSPIDYSIKSKPENVQNRKKPDLSPKSKNLNCIKQEGSRAQKHQSTNGFSFHSDAADSGEKMPPETLDNDGRASSTTETIAPLAVLTQVMQFILGSLSAPSDTALAPCSTPTLGDQLVERCLQVIMRDGEEGSNERDGEEGGSERDGEEGGSERDGEEGGSERGGEEGGSERGGEEGGSERGGVEGGSEKDWEEGSSDEEKQGEDGIGMGNDSDEVENENECNGIEEGMVGGDALGEEEDSGEGNKNNNAGEEVVEEDESDRMVEEACSDDEEEEEDGGGGGDSDSDETGVECNYRLEKDGEDGLGNSDASFDPRTNQDLNEHGVHSLQKQESAETLGISTDSCGQSASPKVTENARLEDAFHVPDRLNDASDTESTGLMLVSPKKSLIQRGNSRKRKKIYSMTDKDHSLLALSQAMKCTDSTVGLRREQF